jgi:Family of unknown function (DUF6444)
VIQLPDLSRLSHDEKDALILALWAQVQLRTAGVAELEAKLGVPPKTPDNSSMPPSQGKKPNRAKKVKRSGPRRGSLGRMGGGRALAANPDEVVTAAAGDGPGGPPRNPAIHVLPQRRPWSVRPGVRLRVFGTSYKALPIFEQNGRTRSSLLSPSIPMPASRTPVYF